MVVERAHSTIRDKLLRYFTYKNIYRYIDVLTKFAKAYNDTLHTTTGMATSRVTDANAIAIWRRMVPRRKRILVANAKFRVGQHVRISIWNMKF